MMRVCVSLVQIISFGSRLDQTAARKLKIMMNYLVVAVKLTIIGAVILFKFSRLNLKVIKG